ncbi:DUF5329 domain-containing protein [Vibrio hannami]|uniref:DUF5329 domain-containing protein n=1 Tax=Vibrio hannami TaxID=2717094 RepID=UPI00240ED84D|nr:DUF5329 domain-containing protein [Vibrio hannami]MDG3086274.1 DUF5329 domain-containing protein [Vibrio hannami]
MKLSVYPFALICVAMSLAAQSSTELETTQDTEIRHILSVLEQSDCQFIRNGKRYSGAKAADHLAGKYDYARDKIESAESFIENIASASYFSGKPYQVDCPDESVINSEQWLKQVLSQYRKQKNH